MVVSGCVHVHSCALALVSGSFYTLTLQIFHFQTPPDVGGHCSSIAECSACHPGESNHDQAL